jgi:peptide/nickel transport system ATP-binding protein
MDNSEQDISTSASAVADGGAELVDVRELSVEIAVSKRRSLRAVDDVSLSIRRGETVGLVGESGSGKTTLGMAIAGLLPSNARVTTGSVRIGSETLTGRKERELCAIRGDLVGVVFQDPMTALNPTMTVGRQVAESWLLHRPGGREEARAEAEKMLELVGMPSPRRALDSYPHQLSGGMRQRACIAAALICRPALLVADEPTTALDVTTQDQIMRLFGQLKEELDMAILLITHDMGVVAGHTDRVAVMYAGQVVEQGETVAIFDSPRHRYTTALLDSVTKLDCDKAAPLRSILGMPPNLGDLSEGCHFAARCQLADDTCRQQTPRWASASTTHQHRCFHPSQNGQTDA